MINTLADLQASTILIDGVDIYAAVGALVESFTIGGTPITSSAYQGKNSTNFNLLLETFGLRSISFRVFFEANSRNALTLKKSKLDGMLWGKPEIRMPDGFYYTAHLTSLGELAILGQEGTQVIASAEYELEGIQHDTLVTSTGNTVQCTSTAPYTNVRLTCTASEDYDSLQIGTVTITGVHAGDVLVVDSIDGRILQNGAPCAGNMTFLRFPQLIPGSNTIECPETLTVEYYPTYI